MTMLSRASWMSSIGVDEASDHCDVPESVSRFAAG